MTFDGFFIHHILTELRGTLTNGRITKIHHPNDDEMVLTIRAQRTNYKLLINISANAARVQLTNALFKTPEYPSNFCMVLRKHLEGAKIIDIQQLGLDRIITFLFEVSDDMGDLLHYHLTVELMGKHSNIFLINPKTNHIIECIKHVPLYKNTHRTILPNAQYVLPPYQNKANPLTATLDNLKQKLPINASAKDIQHTLQGLSLTTITRILHYATTDNIDLSTAIFNYCHLPITPLLLENGFSAVTPFTDSPSASTLSDLLDIFYEKHAKNTRLHHLTHAIRQKLSAILARNTTKLARIETDMTTAETSDLLRIKGELLTAYNYAIQRGMTQVTLDNFYDEYRPITIDLKPEKNAAQNAKDYFKKYQKLKQSIQHLTQQHELITNENNYLESVLVQLHNATLDAVEDIKLELMTTGYLKQHTKGKSIKLSKLGPMRFKSSDGTIILVGRNNLQNDQLTLKQSKKDFIWLHTKDIPGSHVIIQSATPTPDTLQLGAQLAAFYSKYQQSSNVPVDYVAIQHIKKPNGAKPGFVIYEKQKTLLTTPNEAFIDVHRIVD